MTMNRLTITPESEDAWLALRTEDLTSTDIPALFGLSPYKTHFELWYEKKAGEINRLADNERMKWGRRLESVVAQGIAEDNGWHIRPMKEYMRLPEHRLGSSFDFRISAPYPKLGDPPNVRDTSQDENCKIVINGTKSDSLLEIKNVDFLAFRDGWTIDEGFIEAPPHIEIQVQHQMLVSGLKRAYIGVMVGGNRIEVIEREADPQVHAGILAKAAEFWQSIDNNTPPDPVMPDDAEAVIRMNQFAEPGKLLDARNDASIASLLREYHQYGLDAKIAEEHRKVLKAELLQMIGDHEKVLADGFTVSAGIVGPAEIAYTREGYRNFRVTPKKTTQTKEAAE